MLHHVAVRCVWGALLGLIVASPVAAEDHALSVAGFAFVDSSVTSMGSRAQLPEGAKIFPSGAKVTGQEGCSTNPYHTDGLLVVVMDYQGRPSAGSVQVIRHPASGGDVEGAPYYLDFNPGRVLQYLGPIFENGTYDLKIEYFFGAAQTAKASATLELARDCPN